MLRPMPALVLALAAASPMTALAASPVPATAARVAALKAQQPARVAQAIALRNLAPKGAIAAAPKVEAVVFPTAFTGGLANPLLSFGEDVVTLLLFALAVLVPLVVVLLLVLAGVFLGRRLLARPAVPGA